MVEMQNVTASLKTICQFLPKLKVAPPYDPALVLLGIYIIGLKTYIHTKPYKRMFRAGSFIIAKH